ncbi:MAG: hypothetical protein F6K19_24145 [Cyanothece sp. SIO1E1]|nr:hypothetical protein [Cyanothece sp. SIO1E1]
MVVSVYTSAFLRVYRSLKFNLIPNQRDVEHATYQGWEVPLSKVQTTPASQAAKHEEATTMPAPERLATVQRWLTETTGWQRIRARYDDGRPYSDTAILTVAENCAWASLEDMSDLPYAKQKVMHQTGLEIGWGSKTRAYQHQSSKEAGVYFFNAYKENG